MRLNRRSPYDILDSHRIRRQNTHIRRIEWRVSTRTKSRFEDMLSELLEIEGIDDPLINSQREALQEDIRSLPGYPRGYDPDRDVIVPVPTSETV